MPRPILLAACAASLLAGCATDDGPPAPPALATASDRCAAELGCATQRNLRVMLADPHDLDIGRALPAAEGEETFLAIRRLRAAQPRPLAGGTTGATTAGGR